MYNYNNSKNFRLVKEITHQESKDLKWQVMAVQSLHATTKAYKVGLFDDTKMVCVACKKNNYTKERYAACTLS